MANLLQIKRTTTSNAPETLKQGELAFAGGTNKLFIGNPSVEDDVIELSDLSVLSLDNSSASQKLLLAEGSSNGSNVTSLVVPNLGSAYTLSFPDQLTAGNILNINDNGSLSFDPASLPSLHGNINDIESGSPVSGDVLVYDGTEWDHITPSAFKTKLGFSGSMEFTNLVVNGNLTVAGSTELDVASVLTKDKTLALGVSGGVLEGTIDTYDTGTGSTAITVAGLGVVNIGDLRWIDGNGIGFSDVVAATAGGAGSFSCNLATGLTISAGTACFVSVDVVTDAAIDGSGIRMIGSTIKEITWNDNNDEFALTGGSLVVSGNKLIMEGIAVVDTSTNRLNAAIEVAATSLDGTLDGGTF